MAALAKRQSFYSTKHTDKVLMEFFTFTIGLFGRLSKVIRTSCCYICNCFSRFIFASPFAYYVSHCVKFLGQNVELK